MRKIKSLRYFARFRGDYGYLRAIITYQGQRKYILAPYTITTDQLARLHCSGRIKNPKTDSDLILMGRLRDYTSYVWQVVNPLIASGDYTDISSEELSDRIENAMKEGRERNLKRATDRAEKDFLQRTGKAISRIEPQDFARIIEDLKKKLTPEEYAALWVMADRIAGERGQE